MLAFYPGFTLHQQTTYKNILIKRKKSKYLHRNLLLHLHHDAFHVLLFSYYSQQNVRFIVNCVQTKGLYYTYTGSILYAWVFYHQNVLV